MYKIVNSETGALIGFTETPDYIVRDADNGCLRGVEENETPLGVAYKSTPYNLCYTEGVGAEEEVVVLPVDAGDIGVQAESTETEQRKLKDNMEYMAMELGVDLDA